MENDLDLGARIRDIRKQRKLTMKAIADRAGVTISLISHIERNRANPSVSTLKKLADALEVQITAFFGPDVEETGPVVRKFQRKRLSRPGKGVTYSLLTPDRTFGMELIFSEYEPGANSGEYMFRHRGEEVGYVLEGTMRITVGNDSYLLEEGDAIYFDCMVPHRVENMGRGVLRALWAITPASF